MIAVAEIRLNFTISTDDHPELACLEAVGASRRGGRSTEVIRLLKLGARADMALRAMEDDRLAQAVNTGLLTDGARQAKPPGTVAVVAAQVPRKASTQPPVGAPSATADPRPPLPITAPELPQQAPVDLQVPRFAFSQNTAPAAADAAPRRSGRSKATHFMS